MTRSTLEFMYYHGMFLKLKNNIKIATHYKHAYLRLLNNDITFFDQKLIKLPPILTNTRYFGFSLVLNKRTSQYEYKPICRTVVDVDLTHHIPRRFTGLFYADIINIAYVMNNYPQLENNIYITIASNRFISNCR